MAVVYGFKSYYLISDSDSDFHLVGFGWCRPDGCNLDDKTCRVYGFVKDEVDSDKCRTACLKEPLCTGFASSTAAHRSVPNRCFVHGNISSIDGFSDWNVLAAGKTWSTEEFSRSNESLQSQHTVPTKSSGHSYSICWRRKGV